MKSHEVTSFAGSSLVHQFAVNHTTEFATTIAELDADEVQSTLEGLDESVLACVIADAPKSFSTEFIAKQEEQRIVTWLTTMPEKHARRLLRRLPDETRKHVSERAEQDPLLKTRLKYGHFRSDEAGGIADPRFIRVYHSQTVQTARHEISVQKALNTSIAIVLDDDDNYLGIVDPIELLRSNPSTRIQECTIAAPTIPAKMPIRTVAKLKSWRGAQTLPVTDRENKVVGVLNWDEVPAHHASSSARPNDASVVPEVLELMPHVLSGLLSSTNHSEA